jgi:hypothetical protein
MGIDKSAGIYLWSSGDCRFGLSDGQTKSCSGLEARFWTTFMVSIERSVASYHWN